MSDPINQSATPASTTAEDNTVAILAYLGQLIFGIGIIIAIIMHSNKKTTLGAYHLRQSLGLLVTAVALWIPGMIIAVIPFVNLLLFVLWPVIGIGLLVLWFMGLLAAVNRQMKPLPIVGEYYQKWFAGAFA